MVQIRLPNLKRMNAPCGPRLQCRQKAVPERVYTLTVSCLKPECHKVLEAVEVHVSKRKEELTPGAIIILPHCGITKARSEGRNEI